MNEISNNRAICILGMHRSGTSAVARVINLLGVPLGNPEKLIGGEKDINPKGYWEHRYINNIHDNILNALSRTWNDISPMPDKWLGFPEIAPYKQKLKELIREEFANELLWGFKEPRTCLLIPLWNQIFGEMNLDVSYLIVLRNPIDVANSLNERDKLSFNESLLLWQQHTLLSLTNTKGYRRSILHYDNLLRDWKSALKKISRYLDIPWPSDESELEEEMKSFLDTSLRHSHSTSEELEDLRVPNSVKQTYSMCLKAEKNPEFLRSEEFAKEAEDLLLDFQMYSQILLPELRESLHIKNKTIRLQEGYLKNRDSQIAMKDHELRNKNKTIENKNRTIQNMDFIIQEKDNLIKSKEKFISDMVNTWSWKLTRPFRWFGEIVSRF